MFSRQSLSRRQTTTSSLLDPLSASTEDSSQEQVVGAINRMTPASELNSSKEHSSSTSLYGKHEAMREMSAPDQQASYVREPLPSVGISRSRSRRSTVPLNKSSCTLSHTIGTDIQKDTANIPTIEALAKSAARKEAEATPIEYAVEKYLPHDSLGKKVWKYFQVAPELSDLRDMIADNSGGILLLSQQATQKSRSNNESGTDDLETLVNDNVLFTEQPTKDADDPSVGTSSFLKTRRKFTTASGICGSIDGGSINVTGMLPAMESIMDAITDSDRPRSTIFDVLDQDVNDSQEAPLVHARIISYCENLQLPDNRTVQVAIVARPLQMSLVVGSTMNRLGSNIHHAIDEKFSSLIPSVQKSIIENDEIMVDIEHIIQFAHSIESRPLHQKLPDGSSSTTSLSAAAAEGFRMFPWLRSAAGESNSSAKDSRPDANADSQLWQRHISSLNDHILSFLQEIERESSACGDTESRKRISLALIEVVEQMVCEALYKRIFSPWFSDDRAHDESLASKVAALNISNISLQHLGVDTQKGSPKLVIDLARICTSAGAQLQAMDAVKTPAEKLKLVVDAHKLVVDQLDRLNARIQATNDREKNARTSKRSSKGLGLTMMSSTSTHNTASEEGDERLNESPSMLSADSIFPLLVFAVIKANPSHFVSNLRYIQRYRASHLLVAQFEYCMTNAQAIVSFVESVDPRDLGLSAVVSSTALERAKPPFILLQNLLLNNMVSSVGKDVVLGVADGGKKVAAGVFDATFGRLIDSTSNFALRPPWKSPTLEKELLQQGKGIDEKDGEPANVNNLISGVRSALSSASEQLDNAGIPNAGIPRSKIVPQQRKASVNTHIGQNDQEVLPIVNEKFLEMSADDLTIGEVSELLECYKRLAESISK